MGAYECTGLQTAASQLYLPPSPTDAFCVDNGLGSSSSLSKMQQPT
jgi:hypothetical protein